MKCGAVILAALIGLAPVLANALSLEFPAGAVQTANSAQPFGSAQLPIGVFENGSVPKLTAEGAVSFQAWKIQSDTRTTLQIMAPLRQQLADDGYEILLDCETDQCGGFDFRFEIEVLPEPEMHVNLGDFRYVSARRERPGEPEDYVALVVSRGGNSGFLQITRIGAPAAEDTVIIASTKSAAPQPKLPDTTLQTLLASVGRAPLEDLSFQTGSSNLGENNFQSLAGLAAYLKANPEKTVALVGHTDATGTLAANLALSKKRAASVLQRLVSKYGVPDRQLEAAGVGYLVPRASNLTADGRSQNRRVEVILTSTSIN